MRLAIALHVMGLAQEIVDTLPDLKALFTEFAPVRAADFGHVRLWLNQFHSHHLLQLMV
jgi:hypothetical protein